MKITKQRIEENVIRETFFKLLPIQAIATGLPNVNNLITSLIISSSFGSVAMAVMGLVGPFTHILTAISTMLGIGSQLACGRYLGEGNREKMQKIFCTDMLLCLSIGLVVSILTLNFPEVLARILGANEDTFDMVVNYLRGYGYSCIFVIMTPSVLPFLQLDNAKLLSTVSAITMVVVNIGLNILNITVFKMQMIGVGLSLSIAFATSMLICLPHFIKKSQNFRLGVRDFSVDSVKEICSKGVSSAVSPLCVSTRDRIINFVVTSIGGTPLLSALSVAVQLTTVGGMVANGYQGTLNLVSSVLLGERDKDTLREMSKITMKLVFPIYAAVYLVYFIFAPQLATWFGAETANLALYVMVVRNLAFYLITNTFKNPTMSMAKTLKMTGTVIMFTVLNEFIFPLLVELAAYVTGSAAIAVSYTWVAEVLLVATYVVYYRIRSGKMPKGICYLSYIPDDVSVPDGDRFGFTIDRREDGIRFAKNTAEFLQSKGMNESSCEACRAFIDSYASYSVKYRFPKDTKPLNTMDVRVFYENGKAKLLFRDNCYQFDPKAWTETYQRTQEGEMPWQQDNASVTPADDSSERDFDIFYRAIHGLHSVEQSNALEMNVVMCEV